LKPRLIECFERCYDAILAEGLGFHAAQVPLAPCRPYPRRLPWRF
jgi:hypothetical protein